MHTPNSRTLLFKDGPLSAWDLSVKEVFGSFLSDYSQDETTGDLRAERSEKGGENNLLSLCLTPTDSFSNKSLLLSKYYMLIYSGTSLCLNPAYATKKKKKARPPSLCPPSPPPGLSYFQFFNSFFLIFTSMLLNNMHALLSLDSLLLICWNLTTV